MAQSGVYLHTLGPKEGIIYILGAEKMHKNVCMYIYVCVYVYADAYVDVNMHMYIWRFVFLCLFMCTYMYVRKCLCFKFQSMCGSIRVFTNMNSLYICACI